MISEVHVEFICRDNVWGSLKTWATQNPQARMMVLVDSCPHCETILSPCDPSDRYKELGETNPMGLHTHLFYPRHWWIDNLDYEQQYMMLSKGLQRLRDCSIETTHFSPGNWKFNKDTIEACYELELLNFHWYEHEDNRNTVKWAKKTYGDMNFISAKKRYTHDWTIHYGNKNLVRV